MRDDLRKAIEAAQHGEATGVLPTWARTALVSAITAHGSALLLASDQIFGPLTGRYGEVLVPFVALMDRELHANAGKGDRPGWLCMTPEAAVLEVHHHVAKLQKAVLTGDQNGVREYAADVANMSMMAVDVCRALTAAPAPGKGDEA